MFKWPLILKIICLSAALIWGNLSHSQSFDPVSWKVHVQQQLDSLRLLIQSTTSGPAKKEHYIKLQRLTTSNFRDVELLPELLALADTLGDTEWKMFLYSRSIYPFILKGRELQLPMQYLQEATDYYLAQKDTLNYSRCLVNFSFINRRQGNFETALGFLLQSLKLKKAIGHHRGISIIYLRLALLHNGWGEHETALKYLDLVQETQVKHKIKNARISLLSNYGETYQAMGDYKKAAANYEEVLKLRGYPKSLHDNMWLNQTKGKIAFFQKKYERAIAHFEAARELGTTAPGYLNYGIFSMDLFEVYRRTGKVNKTKQVLEQAIYSLENSYFHEDLGSAFDDYAKILAAEGNYKLANAYKEKYYATQRNIYSISKGRKIREMELALTFEAYDYQKSILDNQVKINSSNINQQESVQRALTNASVVVSLSALLFVFLWQRSKKRGKKITQQNLLIQENLESKEYLLKEIHHRVKNNLQMISSLLNLQSKHLNNPEGQMALLEARNRVRSMALIHANLYTADNLAKIDLSSYIQQLVEDLVRTYNIPSNRIQIVEEFEQLVLQPQQAISLGLIVNESIGSFLKSLRLSEVALTINIAINQRGNDIALSISHDQAEQLLVDQGTALSQQIINSMKKNLHARGKIDLSAGILNIIFSPQHLKNKNGKAA